jgi:hypothetical protein
MAKSRKRIIPMNSEAETTPNGPSTRTGKVHKRKLGCFEAALIFFLESGKF